MPQVRRSRRSCEICGTGASGRRNLNLIINLNVRQKFILTLAFTHIIVHAYTKHYMKLKHQTLDKLHVLTASFTKKLSIFPVFSKLCRPEIWSYSTIQDICTIPKSTAKSLAQGQRNHSTCSFPRSHDLVLPMSRRNSKHDCSPSLSFLPGGS